MAQRPKYVDQYETAKWRGSMCLLEFLRKVNGKGQILEHIRKAHAKSGAACSLESFAVRYETFGEKVIAAEMVSMLNDKRLRCRKQVEKPKPRTHVVLNTRPP